MFISSIYNAIAVALLALTSSLIPVAAQPLPYVAIKLKIHGKIHVQEPHSYVTIPSSITYSALSFAVVQPIYAVRWASIV